MTTLVCTLIVTTDHNLRPHEVRNALSDLIAAGQATALASRDDLALPRHLRDKTGVALALDITIANVATAVDMVKPETQP